MSRMLSLSLLVAPWLPYATAFGAPAPGCGGAPPSPEIGDLCPETSITAEVSGDTSSATVTISGDFPACISQNETTDIFTPDRCYSSVTFSIGSSPTCAFLDSYDDGVDRPETYRSYRAFACSESPYWLTLPGSIIYNDWVNFDYRMGFSWDDCSAQFDEAYGFGGPSTDPNAVWENRGPASLTCTYDRPKKAPNGDDTTPNGLFGPTWVGGTAYLEIEYSDGSSGLAQATFWIPVDGAERPRAPIASMQDNGTNLPATYLMTDFSVSQKGNGLNYDWLIEVIDDGQTEFRFYERRQEREPVIEFTEGDTALVTLTITDTVNGLTDSDVEFINISRSNPPVGGGVLPVITVEATDADAAEDGPNTGAWVVHRTRPEGRLVVNVATSGSATIAADYTTDNLRNDGNSLVVVFGPGEDSVNVLLTPVTDALAEPLETATLSIEQGNGYTVGDPDRAAIAIRNLETVIEPPVFNNSFEGAP